MISDGRRLIQSHILACYLELGLLKCLLFSGRLKAQTDALRLLLHTNEFAYLSLIMRGFLLALSFFTLLECFSLPLLADALRSS